MTHTNLKPSETLEGIVACNEISRRQFLKTAATAGASLGLAGSLGTAVAACGGSGETTGPPRMRCAVLQAIKTTKTELITGPIDLTTPVTGPTGMHVTPNLYKQVWGMGQIRRREAGSKWQSAEALVGQIDAPEVKIDDGPIPITYSS